jgi:mRNA interferase RelE/StbE
MNWDFIYLPEAKEDLKKLDKSQSILVLKAIKKVSQNPLPASEGGYGKPLGNKRNIDLRGLLKIKIRSAGIRIVYKLERTEKQMIIVVISVRADDEAYIEAERRFKNK